MLPRASALPQSPEPRPTDRRVGVGIDTSRYAAVFVQPFRLTIALIQIGAGGKKVSGPFPTKGPDTFLFPNHFLSAGGNHSSPLANRRAGGYTPARFHFPRSWCRP